MVALSIAYLLADNEVLLLYTHTTEEVRAAIRFDAPNFRTAVVIANTYIQFSA